MSLVASVSCSNVTASKIKLTDQLFNFLRSAKYPIDSLTAARVYRIPRSYFKVYTGTAKHIKTRVVEYNAAADSYNQITTLAEHTITKPNRVINYNKTTVLSITIT